MLDMTLSDGMLVPASASALAVSQHLAFAADRYPSTRRVSSRPMKKFGDDVDIGAERESW